MSDNASNMKKCFDMALLLFDDVQASEIDENVDYTEDTNLSDLSSDSDCDSAPDTSPSNSDVSEDEDNIDTESESEEALEDAEEKHFSNFNSGADIMAHIPCVPHTVQLAINNALKKDTKGSKTFIKYVTKIMVFFKRSTRWSDELKERTHFDVRIPVTTRWNSILQMLERFKEVYINLIIEPQPRLWFFWIF